MKNILIVLCQITYNWNAWPVPSVGSGYVMASLKAMLKDHNYKNQVFCCNLNLEKGDLKDILKKYIGSYHIDVLMCGDLVVNYNQVKKIMECTKTINKDITTVIGGSLVTNSAEVVMSGILEADFGIIGEGEITSCELIETLVNNSGSGEGYRNIKGIIFRENNKLVETQKRPEIENLDDIPWVDYEGIGYFQMIDKFNSKEDLVSACITTSRSCPFHCTFCSKSGGERYRQRSLDSVFEEIAYLVKQYNVKRIFLNDELFTNDINRLMEFCTKIKLFKLSWVVFLRINDSITENILFKMKNSGCTQIFYGVESGDDRILKSMRKGITVEQIRTTIIKTKNAGIVVSGGFIFGDAEENVDSIKNSLNFLNENMDYFEDLSVDPIMLYPGSQLYDYAVNSGKILNELNFIARECPLTNVSQLSDTQYLELVNVTLPKETGKIFFYKHRMWKNKVKFDSEKDRYLLKIECPECHAEDAHYLLPKDIPFDFDFECSKCKRKTKANVLFQYMKFSEAALNKLVIGKRVGIIGSGRLFSVICSFLNKLNEENVFFIVSDNRKQQWGYGNKKKHLIQDIKKLNLELIIFFKTNSEGHYLKEIEKETHISYFEIGFLKDGLLGEKQ